MTSFDRGPVVGRVFANGEIVEDDDASPRRRAKREGGPMYVMLELDAAERILPALSPTQIAILNAILADYREGEPWCRASAADLADRIGVKVPNLYRSLRGLQASGLVSRVDSTTWQVSPHYGWRGTRKSWAEALSAAEYPDLEALS